MNSGTRISCRTAHSPEARLALAELVPVVHQLFAAGIVPSTAKTYMSGQNQYLKFCEKYYLQPFPTSKSALILFVAYLHQKTLSSGTIKSYLAAIRYHQISQGLKDPNVSKMPHLEYVIKGIKRLSPQSTRYRLPITPSILIKLKEVWKQTGTSLMPQYYGQQPKWWHHQNWNMTAKPTVMCGWTATNIHLAWK